MAGTRDTRSDEGFGLVEVVVSMLLFAVIAVAILPLALQASVLSAGNRDRASAQSFAAGQLADVRAAHPDDAANSCTALVDAAATGVPDAADTGLVADMTVDACPTSYPAAVTVTVAVRDADADAGSPVVEMATKIVVTAP